MSRKDRGEEGYAGAVCNDHDDDDDTSAPVGTSSPPPHLPPSTMLVKHNADIFVLCRYRIIESKAAGVGSSIPVRKGSGVQYVIDHPHSLFQHSTIPSPPLSLSTMLVTYMLTSVYYAGTGSSNPRLRDRGRGPWVRGLRTSGMSLIVSPSFPEHSISLPPTHHRCSFM